MGENIICLLALALRWVCDVGADAILIALVVAQHEGLFFQVEVAVNQSLVR